LRNAPETPRPRAAQRAQEPPKIERDAASVQLRLAIAKAGLGLELAAPAQLGPVSVTELAVVFTGLRFPLDVSGGVARFRHRRGHLRRMVIEAPVAALARWAAPRLAGILGPKPPEVSLLPRRDGVTVTLVEPVDVLDERALAPVLVFEVAMDTSDDDVRLTVHDARGDSLPAPATALALRAMEAALGTLAAREGACFRIAGAAGRLARTLMPDAGARVPSTDAVRWSATLADSEGFILHATHEGAQAESTEEATRAREAAAVTKEADDARIAGDLVRARKLDLAALDRAPKHPEVCRRIAEIDAHDGGRAEAALTTLADAQHAGSPKLGTLPGVLQQETGDVDGAIAAFIRVGEAEPSPALGARGYERAAMLVRDHLDALLWLDLALARAPASPHLRWTRVARRLASGRVREALADVEHLEALATGPKQKYAVWQRAGRAWAHAGLRVEAGELFERALRYAPDDVDALAGLGTALVAEGRAARGVALLGRALDLAARLPKDTSAIAVELATALATKLGDKPGAVAKVRTVPDGVPESLAARGLEGRWRAELGDLAGAALAFARMREAAASLVETGVQGGREEAGAWLMEAAKFEREVRRDLAAAQRHLAIAIRLLPHDEALGVAYRQVCAEMAPATPGPARAEAVAPAPKVEEPDLDEDAAAARVEELTRKLQGDPTQDAIVDELVRLLTRLGRSLELLALLTARLEDAPAERRSELLPKQRSVLTKLEADARAAGRNMEADLFRDALKALE
jgi:tetratricopeptide (TPR) repeat protein